MQHTDGPGGYHTSEGRQDEYRMIPLPRGMENTAQMNLSMTQKQPHTHEAQTCSGRGRCRGRAMELGAWLSRHKLLYADWTKHKGLPGGSAVKNPPANAGDTESGV